MTELILASKSPARAQVLYQAGVEFRSIVSHVDEGAIKQEYANLAPEQLVIKLAEAKSLAVAQKFPNDYVLGCDQILVFDQHVMDKPRDLLEARARLQMLRGQKHELFSALVVIKKGQTSWKNLQKAYLKMRDFQESFLDFYLQKSGEEVCESVGAYKIEGMGIQLFEEIQGDNSTIMGLPIFPLLAYLRDEGFLAS